MYDLLLSVQVTPVRVIRGDFSHGGKRHGGKRKAEPLTGPVIGIDADKGRILIEGASDFTFGIL